MVENAAEKERIRRRLVRLSELLDSAFRVPGTDVRIGLDPLIGLFTGLGDTVGAVASAYIIAASARLGAPKSVQLRMAFNVFIDAVVGAVPLLGDIFDFTWQANRRNVALLEDYLEHPRRAARGGRVFTWMLALVTVALVAMVGALVLILFGLFWQALGGGG